MPKTAFERVGNQNTLMKKLFLGSAALTVFIFSCKKDENTPAIQTTQEQLIGKWNLVKYVDWYTPTASTTTKDTTIAHAGEYIDFRTDTKAYLHLWEGTSFENDTSSYNVNGNIVILNNLVPPNDTLDIQTISSNNLTLHNKYKSPTSTEDTWIFLTK